MRSVNRIPVLGHYLSMLWALTPDQRFGQLVTNTLKGKDLFQVEDDLALKMILEALPPDHKTPYERLVEAALNSPNPPPVDWDDLFAQVLHANMKKVLQRAMGGPLKGIDKVDVFCAGPDGTLCKIAGSEDGEEDSDTPTPKDYSRLN